MSERTEVDPAGRTTHTSIMGAASNLSAIPAGKRRQIAATLGLFTVLFVAVGAVAATGAKTAAAPVFSAISLGIAVLLALMAWGTVHSVRVDAANAGLDDVIEQTVAQHGGQLCDCDHQHDPDQLHVTDAEPCGNDGTGAACTHDCQDCVLAAMRPVPTRSEHSSP